MMALSLWAYLMFLGVGSSLSRSRQRAPFQRKSICRLRPTTRTPGPRPMRPLHPSVEAFLTHQNTVVSGILPHDALGPHPTLHLGPNRLFAVPGSLCKTPDCHPVRHETSLSHPLAEGYHAFLLPANTARAINPARVCAVSAAWNAGDEAEAVHVNVLCATLWACCGRV